MSVFVFVCLFACVLPCHCLFQGCEEEQPPSPPSRCRSRVRAMESVECAEEDRRRGREGEGEGVEEREREGGREWIEHQESDEYDAEIVIERQDK